MKAIITGISSGIGQAIALKLEKQGWHVIGLSHKDIDLTNLKAVANIGDKLRLEHKEVNALIHTAGIWHDKDRILADKNFAQFEPLQIIETMNVGLTSFMVLAAKLLPAIPHDGAIIGITGTFAQGGAGWLPYYTSKRALEDFLVGLAQDYKDGPKVFGISPADTATKAYKKFYPQYVKDAQSPTVISDLVMALISRQKTYNSGEIIEIRNGKDKKGYHV